LEGDRLRVGKGQLTRDSEVTLFRPHENSPNNVTEIYSGTQDEITYEMFEDRDAELTWIAKSIAKDVKREDVPPEQILVISLDARRAKRYMLDLQAKLFR